VLFSSISTQRRLERGRSLTSFWISSAELFHPRGELETVRLRWPACGFLLSFLNDRFSKFLSSVRASPALLSAGPFCRILPWHRSPFSNYLLCENPIVCLRRNQAGSYRLVNDPPCRSCLGLVTFCYPACLIDLPPVRFSGGGDSLFSVS